MLSYLFGSNKNFKILIAYCSVTGNAENIAKILLERLRKRFNNIFIKELNNVEIDNLNQYDYIIIIISTTGDGEYPDNSRLFCKKIRKYRENKIENLKVAMLGLGSTDYNNFCHASKCLDRILKRLKIKYFMDVEYADDAIGLECIVEPWMNKVVEFLFNEHSKIRNWFIKSMSI